MKTFRKLSFLMLCFLSISLVLTSCRKDDDGDNGGGNSAGEGTITAKVNGSQYTSIAMSSSAKYITSGGFGQLMIMGTSSDLKTINLNLSHLTSKATGTYDIGGTNSVLVNASYIESTMSGSSQTWMSPYDGSAVRGSITITDWTESNIKGTFKFDAALQSGSSIDTSNIKNVTEGSFNMKVQ